MPCTFIGNHATQLFEQLTEVFQYKLKMSETGLTDLFIFELTKYCDLKKISSVKVYHAKKEAVYGADIDLFVQQKSKKYLWFALQAKVMNRHGKYKDLRIKKKTPQQWEKLKDHEKKHGCKAFYLLYNGDYTAPPSSLPSPKNHECLTTPFLEEYGLGIVKRSDIDHHFTSGNTSASFTDFYPTLMNTLKKLVCCDYDISVESMTEYEETEIHTAAPYQRIWSTDSGVVELKNKAVEYYAPFRIIISQSNSIHS